jgi:hypothetical protein
MIDASREMTVDRQWQRQNLIHSVVAFFMPYGHEAGSYSKDAAGYQHDRVDHDYQMNAKASDADLLL